MKVIKTVGIEIPSENAEFIRLDSFASLSEADIVVFSPNFSHTYYNTSYEKYMGKPIYDHDSSAKITEHIKHWCNEISSFLMSGKTIFFILTPIQDFCVYTGEKRTSGTGRNQKITHIVQDMTNYAFLSNPKIKFIKSSGKVLVPESSLVKDFHKNFESLMSFEVHLKIEMDFMPLFYSKNKDKLLGAHLTNIKGAIVFLPNLSFNLDDLTEDNDEGSEVWTDEALIIGEKFKQALTEMDRAIRKESQKTPKPSWLEGVAFELSEAQNTKQIIVEAKKQIKILQEKIMGLQSELKEQESLQDLLFETGKPLEFAVIKALRILGFQAENYDDGKLELDQIITSPEGFRYIGECEGKDSKDIDVSKFRQLIDGLSADFEKGEVPEKAFGLLFGNPQRLTNPSERTLDFTQKCKDGAKRDKIGLIKTPDLFHVCKYIMETQDKEFAEKCRKAIHEQLGEIINFPAVSQ